MRPQTIQIVMRSMLSGILSLRNTDSLAHGAPTFVHKLGSFAAELRSALQNVPRRHFRVPRLYVPSAVRSR